MGDITVGTALACLGVRFSEFAWRVLYPNLAAFCARMEQRPCFIGSRPVPQTIKDAVVSTHSPPRPRLAAGARPAQISVDALRSAWA